MPAHKNAVNIHKLYDQEYADTTARDADTTWNTDATNIGKSVRITADNSLYWLSGTGPTTWEPLGSTAADTIYSADGTTSSARTVTLSADFNIVADTDGSHTVEIGDSLTDRIDTFNVWADGTASLNAGATNDRSFVTLFGTALKGIQLQYFENETSAMGFNINVADDGDFEVIDQVASKGMIYAADYSANFTDRSIVDLQYVNEGDLTWSAQLRTFDMFSNAELDIEAFDTATSTTYNDRMKVDITPDLLQLLYIQGNGAGAQTGQRGFEISDTYVRTYLDDQDWVVYKGDSTSTTELVTFHGDGNHSVFDPFITLHEGHATSAGTDTQPVITNYNKANALQFNDGTASSYLYRLETIVNASQVVQYFLIDHGGGDHRWYNLRNLDWYFDTTGTRQWSIYDDDIGNTPTRLFNLDRSGFLELGESGTPTDIRWKSGVTPDDEWRMRAGASSDRFQFLYYDDSAGTADVVSIFDSVGTWRIAGEVFTEDQTTLPLPPAYPSQIEGAATNVTVTTTDQVIVLDSATIDRSLTEYTINTTDNRIEFDAADGTKVYEVCWHANFLLDGQGTTGATRSTAVIHAELDAVDVTGSEEWCYIREYQGGINGFANSGTSGSFLIQPALDDQLTFLVRGETEAGETLTDFELDSLTVVIKRLT